ncbi:MAG: polyprenol monophosphomannose synthase [Candidatus Kapabacteria bacterium]|jgi:dolichol-phosphate mannosyltransferase|nr:polyprenol monophosphomannose synthase [Candidatus Kapabacteria bacterium]
MKNIVVIPTYNELDNIANIIEAVQKAVDGIHVLIVDDNSPDGTADVVKVMMESNDRLHLILRAGKMGLGTAYCEGFAYALERGFEYICEMDADFSHNPEDLSRFLKEIENNDLIIGSRYSEGVNVVNWPLSRLILSYGANLYTRIITGMPVKDATGGFKCFRADALRKINLKTIKSNGYGFQIEMNYRMWKSGARVKEVPIIFIDRRSGVSKMNNHIIYEAIFLVWKLKFSFNKHMFNKDVQNAE